MLVNHNPHHYADSSEPEFDSHSIYTKRRRTRRSVITKRALLVIGVLALVGTGAVGIYSFCRDSHDLISLNQRLFGQVMLVDGTHPARSVSELNRLSWENGLNILDTLDTMNAIMNKLAAPHLTADAETSLEQKLTRSHNKLREALNDKNTLLKAARFFHHDNLDSPEYAENMRDALTRYTALKSRANAVGRLVEDTKTDSTNNTIRQTE